MGAPNPFRKKYREHLGEAVRQIVAAGTPFADAVATLGVAAEDQAPFAELLREELQLIEPYNCARYRLPIGTTEKWIGNGRPIR